MDATPTLQERIDYTTVLPEPTKRLILAGVLLTLFLTALDQTIVAAALPKILAELKGVGLLAWLSTAYLLCSTATVPIYGKLSDLYGRKPILLIGISIFLVGSMLCGLAPTILTLAICRGLQGLGAGAITALAFTIPADLYVPAERAKLQGLFTSVFALSSVLGPFLGGFLTDTLGWRWIFYVNLPFGAIAVGFIVAYMPRLESGLRTAVDYLGAVLLVATVVPLLLALTLDRTVYPWTSPTILGLLGGSIFSLITFLWVEKRAEGPILPLQLFKLPIYTLIIGISSLMGSVFLTVVLFISLFLVNVLGTTATEAGTALIPLTIGLMVSSILCGNIVQRTGRYKIIALIGLTLVSTGVFLLSQLSVTSTIWDVRLKLGIMGLGFGATFPQLNLALQNAVSYSVVGSATASRQFFQQLGQAIGAAIFGALLASLLTSAIAHNLEPIIAPLPPELGALLHPDRLRNGRAEAVKELGSLTAQLPANQKQALSQKVDQALRQSFASGVAQIYAFTVPLPLLALLFGFGVPELPLRKSNQT
ncbi:MAG: MFS transporter [Anaerolineae bacterium]|nr:MFS transporter [Gloeobacterales cyanobacterium ES-bin-313]